MNLREAAKQALEALEDSHQNINPERRYADELTRQIADAITSIRAALAENAMQRLTDEQQMIERGTKAWADAHDATAWVEELRGHEPVTDCHEKDGDNLSPPLERHADTSKTSAHIADAGKMVATGQESRQVEPVGFGVFEDGNLHDSFRLEHEAKLFAALKGEHAEVKALYIVAPTVREDRTVEPVAYIHETGFLVRNLGATLTAGMKLYTAPPKREPLTKEQLLYVYNQLPNWGMDMDSISQDLVAFARAIERAHGIGGEE